MSIEALIREQIETLKANTAAVLLLESTLVGRAGGNSKTAKEEKPKAEEVVTAKGDSVTSKAEDDKNARHQAAVEEAAEVIEQLEAERIASEASAEGKQPLTYDNLRDLVLLLAKSGKREEIKSTFGKHGIESGKDLLEKADDPATVKDHKKLAEVYADMKKLEG